MSTELVNLMFRECSHAGALHLAFEWRFRSLENMTMMVSCVLWCHGYWVIHIALCTFAFVLCTHQHTPFSPVSMICASHLRVSQRLLSTYFYLSVSATTT